MIEVIEKHFKILINTKRNLREIRAISDINFGINSSWFSSFRLFKSFRFLLNEFQCTIYISYEILPIIIIVFWLGIVISCRDFFNFHTLIAPFHTTPLFLPSCSFFFCLILLLWSHVRVFGKALACMSSTFSRAKLNCT